MFHHSHWRPTKALGKTCQQETRPVPVYLAHLSQDMSFPMKWSFPANEQSASDRVLVLPETGESPNGSRNLATR